MLEEILELHKSGQLELAEGRYRELLAFNPDDAEALHLLGMLRRQSGDIAEAIALVTRATELVPDRANYFATLGGMLLHARQWDGARAAFGSAVKLDPNFTSGYSALAQIGMLTRDHAEAERNFKLALRAGDERVEVLTGYGNLLIARGDAELGIKYLTRAVELWPKVASAQGSLGRAYLDAGHLAFAEQALGNALELHAEFHTARLLLAEAQFKQGKFAEALANLAPLRELPAHRGAALAIDGDIARAQGRLDDAIAAYRESLAAKPGQARVVEVLVWCLLRGNQRSEALLVLDAHLAQRPTDAVAQRLRAQLVAQAGDFKASAEGFRKALATSPDDALLRLSLAAMLELDGDLEAAEHEADAVLAREPGQVGAAQIKARAQLARGDARGALATLGPADEDALPGHARRLGAALRGHAHAAVGEAGAAVAAWVRSQRARGGSTDLPRMPEIPRAFGALVGDAAERARALSEVVPAALLVGAPGSGVDLLAALLADTPAITLLADRFSSAPRVDPFAQPDFRRILGSLDEGDARILARHYERPLKRLGSAAGTRLIDWLPHWDVRFVPLVLRIFGPVPLIVATREPRDALLQWLAFGTPQGLSCADPVGAAAWLESANEHLAWTQGHAGMPVLTVDTAELREHPERACARIGEFLGIAPPTPGASFARAKLGLGGLPNHLPAGASGPFEYALRAAFAELKTSVA